jgi:GcrA cell cycle regulator
MGGIGGARGRLADRCDVGGNEANMYWTDEKVEYLRQLWLDGKSASQIAAELGDGVTRNAVIGKVHRLGLSGRVKTSAPSVPRVRQRPPQAARSPSARSGGFRGNAALAMARDPHIEAEPEIREDVVIPMSLRVTIVELKEAMCRWPLGDPVTPEFRYCGIQTQGEGPYCLHHGRMAYQPAQDRRRERERRMAARTI